MTNSLSMTKSVFWVSEPFWTIFVEPIRPSKRGETNYPLTLFRVISNEFVGVFVFLLFPSVLRGNETPQVWLVNSVVFGQLTVALVVSKACPIGQ